MKWFFKDNEKIFNLKGMNPADLIYRVMPHLMGEIMSKYFRTTVEGYENIPKSGPCIITPNHSGYSGFDAFLLGHHIFNGTGRRSRILTHKLWFLNKTTAIPLNRLGFIEATRENGLQALQKNKPLVLFPEGESGNFKPSNKAYHLQRFRSGFVRMAIEKKCPIVPTLILGAEETHINLAKLKFSKYLRGTVLPLPLNILPLPAKWHIIFMKPQFLPYTIDHLDDEELIRELCDNIREQMQQRLSLEVNKRKNLYF